MLMRDAETWIAARLQTVNGISVTYRRGAATVTLTASPSWHEFKNTDVDTGEQITERVRQYTFTTSELVLAGRAFVPRDGDRIEETVGSETHVFEVMPVKSLPSQIDSAHRKLTTVYATRVHRG